MRLPWAAEAAGTALLMFGGLSAIAVALGSGSPLAGAGHATRLLIAGALFGSCVTLVALSPLGRLSGAHLNPAVTIAFRMLGMLSRRDVGGYIAGQFAGAVAGSLAFRAVWGSVAQSVDGGVTHVTVPIPLALLVEAAGTAVLVGTILLFGSRERLAPWTPVAIVPVIAALVWAGGDATGASLNPARSGGPALAFGDFADLWLYAVAPIAGAAAVAAAWKLRDPSRRPKAASICPAPAAS